MKTMVGCEIREHLRQHSALEVRGRWFHLLLVLALSQLVALYLKLFADSLKKKRQKRCQKIPHD